MLRRPLSRLPNGVHNNRDRNAPRFQVGAVSGDSSNAANALITHEKRAWPREERAVPQA